MISSIRTRLNSLESEIRLIRENLSDFEDGINSADALTLIKQEAGRIEWDSKQLIVETNAL